MCLVCTNVTQVLQHLFLRSPSNGLLMRSLESRCGPRSAGDSPQIWLEIALTELMAPLLRVMTNTWTLDWSPGGTRVFAIISADHSLASPGMPLY